MANNGLATVSCFFYWIWKLKHIKCSVDEKRNFLMNKTDSIDFLAKAQWLFSPFHLNMSIFWNIKLVEKLEYDCYILSNNYISVNWNQYHFAQMYFIEAFRLLLQTEFRIFEKSSRENKEMHGVSFDQFCHLNGKKSFEKFRRKFQFVGN